MARVTGNDPLDKFRWQVQIDGFTRLGFHSVDAPAYTINTKEYKQGGAHLHPVQIVDSITYKQVTLQRGVTSDRSFDEWAKGALRFQQTGTMGNSQSNLVQTLQSTPNLQGYRKNVTILHLDRSGQPIVQYVLYNAFPVEYQPASDFSAEGDDGVSMEKLVLKYEGFTADTPTLANSLLGVLNRGLDAIPGLLKF